MANVRSATTTTTPGGESITLSPGIYLYTVSADAHCCQFGPIGGVAGQALGGDGLPMYK